MAAPVDPVPNLTPHALAVSDQLDLRFSTLYKALNKALSGGGLDAASIQGGTLSLSLLAIEDWRSVALGGGAVWSPADLDFYKDPLGVVHIRPQGYSITPALAAGATICKLPAGYRPGTTIYTDVPGSTPAGRTQWQPNGDVVVAVALPALISGRFSLMMTPSFRAES